VKPELVVDPNEKRHPAMTVKFAFEVGLHPLNAITILAFPNTMSWKKNIILFYISGPHNVPKETYTGRTKALQKNHASCKSCLKRNSRT